MSTILTVVKEMIMLINSTDHRSLLITFLKELYPTIPEDILLNELKEYSSSEHVDNLSFKRSTVFTNLTNGKLPKCFIVQDLGGVTSIKVCC